MLIVMSPGILLSVVMTLTAASYHRDVRDSARPFGDPGSTILDQQSATATMIFGSSSNKALATTLSPEKSALDDSARPFSATETNFAPSDPADQADYAPCLHLYEPCTPSRHHCCEGFCQPFTQYAAIGNFTVCMK